MVKSEVAVKAAKNTPARMDRAERKKYFDELGEKIRLTGEDLADVLMVGGIFVIKDIEEALRNDPTLLEGLLISAAKRVRKLRVRAKSHEKPGAKQKTNQRAHHITMAILLIDI